MSAAVIVRLRPCNAVVIGCDQVEKDEIQTLHKAERKPDDACRRMLRANRTAGRAADCNKSRGWAAPTSNIKRFVMKA